MSFYKIVKIFLFIGSVSVSDLLSAQGNLVLNPSFEEVYSTYQCTNTPTSGYQSNQLPFFTNQILHWRLPIKTCLSSSSVGSPDILCNNFLGKQARSGDKFAMTAGGTAQSEYLIGFLSSAIYPNKRYLLECWVMQLEGDINSGIVFTSEVPKQCDYNKLKYFDNQTFLSLNLTSSTVSFQGNINGWIKVSLIFSPLQEADIIVLGGKHPHEAIFWDDISVTEICEDERYFQNQNHVNENMIYQATNSIFAGNNVLQSIPVGDVKVMPSSNIIYRAGNQVVLEPGFSTEPGCYFEAVIGPCENNPCPAPPFIPQSLELCGNTTAVLGPTSPPDVGLLFSWSPATYLDNPNSPNPTFTAPPGEGTMNYTLTVTSACGYLLNPPFSIEQQLNYPVTIYYNDNPDPNPVLSLSNIQQSHMVFSMDVLVGPSTEKVCISLTDVSTGQVIATECFYADSDFDCCSFSFSNFDFSDATRLLIDPCKDYQVSVQVNNKCNANLATQNFLWDNDQTFSLVVLPNVITPNSDGINDSWLVQANGVKWYELEVRDNNQRVYFANDIVNSFEFRIWDGLCNQGWPACNFGSPCLSDGTYFYILKLIDCNQTVHDYTGFITLLDGTPNGCLNPRAPDVGGNQQAEMNPEAESFLSTENQEIAIGLHLFPNPSDGRLTIVHDHLMGEIQILDVSGRLVKSTSTSGSQTHLELGYLSNGHYLIKLHDQEGKVYFARWVKQ